MHVLVELTAADVSWGILLIRISACPLAQHYYYYYYRYACSANLHRLQEEQQTSTAPRAAFFQDTNGQVCVATTAEWQKCLGHGSRS